NAKLVYVSTDYVFDGSIGPYSEEDKPKPINVYGRSKFEGEQAASSLVENCAIVRISVPFGNRKEGVEHNYISWLIEELSAGNTVRIAKDQRTTPAYLEELGEVLWILARRDIRGVVHYGTSDRLSRYEMALEVCSSKGFSRELVQAVSTDELGLIAKRPIESGFITDKILEIMGRPPILFSNALYRMIENSEMLV
ncbi:SDR family oxidoreductase, partial [Candidatus Latescibacterota bacterium]